MKKEKGEGEARGDGVLGQQKEEEEGGGKMLMDKFKLDYLQPFVNNKN